MLKSYKWYKHFKVWNFTKTISHLSLGDYRYSTIIVHLDFAVHLDQSEHEKFNCYILFYN